MPYWGLTLTRVISGNNLAAVRYNPELKECRVKFYIISVHLMDADYFTDSKDDAIGTAEHQINYLKEKDHV